MVNSPQGVFVLVGLMQFPVKKCREFVVVREFGVPGIYAALESVLESLERDVPGEHQAIDLVKNG